MAAWNAVAANLSVNGVDLATLAALPASLAQLLMVPARRGKDYTVPGRHGVLVVQNKPYDAVAIKIPLMIKGTLADGTIPLGSSAEQEFYARVDALNRLIQAGDTISLSHVLPNGSSRYANAEVTSTFDYSRQSGARPLIGRVDVNLLLTDAFWSDPPGAGVTVSGSYTTGTAIPLPAFGAATAPMADLTAQFGAGNNPSLVQGFNYFTYGGVIPAGSTLAVDFGNYSLGPGPGTTWTPDYSKVSYALGPSWFELDPTQTPLAVTLNHTTGTGVAMTFALSGLRKYLGG